jgi:predicted ester cyclase
MSKENKVIALRLIEEGFNAGNLHVFDELVADSFVNHNPGFGLPPTLDGWKQSAAGMRAAFPDMHVHVEDQIAEGDLVVGRFTAHGTHQGELMGIPATGKGVTVGGIYILRFAGGKIVERWEEADFMGMMVQLGVIPPPGG